VALAALAASLILSAAVPAATPGPPVIVSASIDPALTSPLPPLPQEGRTFQVHAQVEGGVPPLVANIWLVTDDSGWSRLPPLDLSPTGEITGSVWLPANIKGTPMHWRLRLGVRDRHDRTAWKVLGDFEVEPTPWDPYPAVWPTELEDFRVSGDGGRVPLAASASDEGGIAPGGVVAVWAEIFRLDGTLQDTVTLTQTASASSRYTGEYAAPPNPGMTDLRYFIEYWAEDDFGQRDRRWGGTFLSVAPTGKLRASLGALDFGDVPVGRIATRWVSLSNVGRATTEPLTVTLSSSHARFSVAGASTFTLAPGETRAVPVVFRPTSAGARSGRISVTRSDRRQPGFGVDVEGSGIP
jgi:hypothetical protein